MINYKKISADLVILFLVAILSTVFSTIINKAFNNREKRSIIAAFSQRIEERDRTIKILRDSLALDSVLVVIGGKVTIKPDSTGDSLVVGFGELNLRQ